MISACRVASPEKALQIVLLRQQPRVLEREAQTNISLSCPEKLMFVALTARLQVEIWRRVCVRLFCSFDGAQDRLGGTLRNLLTLQALDLLRTNVLAN